MKANILIFRKWIPGLLGAALLITSAAAPALAQYGASFNRQTLTPRDSSAHGLDPSRIFVGGNLGLSFGDFTYINVSPLIGYRFSELFAGGVQINTQYESVKYYDGSNRTIRKDRYTMIGGGVFGRVYPIPQLFVHLQPEENFLVGKRRYYDGTPEAKYRTHVTSVLAGLGYAAQMGATSEFTVMILYDILQQADSPYGNQPIFRAGVNIGL
jgi:hypothetical protein